MRSSFCHIGTVAVSLADTCLLILAVCFSMLMVDTTTVHAASGSATLNTLEVTATLPQDATGDVVHEEHPGSHTRINRERLTQSGSQLGEILAKETGIQQLQSGGFGTFSSITVRAASRAQTAVYLDGILLNSGGQPVIDLSTLELLNIDTVDIYRGATPLQLGHGSIGGAINLSSLKTTGKAGSRIRLGTGSLGQRGLQVSSQGLEQKWDWMAAASFQQSDNDFKFVNDNATPDNFFDDRLERRNNGQAQRAALLLRAGHQGSDTLRTDVTLQAAGRRLGVPEWRNREDNQASYDTDNLQLQLSQVVDDVSNWNTRHNLYVHSVNARYDDRFGKVGTGAQELTTDTRTVGAKSYWETFLPSGTLGLSIDYRYESLDSFDLIAPDDDYIADRRSLLATAHIAWIDATDRWLITPAIRWQHHDKKALNNPASVNSLTDKSSSTDTGLQIGVSWQMNDSIKISTNAGSYFREPSFGELYGSIGVVNGNPALVAEEGVNVDIGVHYSAEKLKLSATGFHSSRKDHIVTSYNAIKIGRPANTGEAEVTGLELSADWQPGSVWHFSANATFQNPRNRPNDKLLPGEARQALYAKVKYKPGTTAFWYEWQANQDRFYDSVNILPAANTSVHSIGLDWQKSQWQVGTRIHNLGGDIIEDFNGFPKPGRTWSLAITRIL